MAALAKLPTRATDPNVLGSLTNTYPQAPTYGAPTAPAWGPQAPTATGAPTTLGGPPVTDPGAAPHSPLVTAPNYPTPPSASPFVAPTVGAAPTATPYGAFTAPNLSTDPSFQGDLAQQQKAVQRSAAARGTLLSGGLLKALQTNASNVANTHLNDITSRALEAYRASRDTNAQNFGQELDSYKAGTGATLDAGRLGLDASDANYGQRRDAYGDLTHQAETAAGVTNANAENAHQDQLTEYARQAALQRQRAMQPYLGRLN